jgi:hypothetical protein
MKGFTGVYATDGGYGTGVSVNNKRYYLGTYKKPERAAIKVKLFRHWLKLGFTIDQLPRLYEPEVVVADHPKYEPIENYKLRMVIKSKGEKQLTPDDMVNIATELQSLRIFKYGKAKALGF